MAQIPNTKTAPQDKDIAVIGPKTTGGTGAREQLSVVLDNLDVGLVNEIANRIADVNSEEARALAAEAVLQGNINAEIAARIADVNAEEARALAAEGVELAARQAADTILQNEIDGERLPFRVTAVSGTSVTINGGFNINRINSAGANSTKLAAPNGSFLTDFQGATLNFSTGVITYLAGYQAPGAFTPINFVGNAGKFAKYALVLLPTLPNTILVLNGDIGATAAVAEPAFDGGIPLAIVTVQDSGAAGVGTIGSLSTASVIEILSSGSGSSGSGSGSVLDPTQESTWVYYSRNDFAVDKKKFYLGGTATDSILGLKKVVFGTIGQTMTTQDLTGLQVRADGVAIMTAQAKLLYTNLKVDNPLVEFSRDGGLAYVTATDAILQSQGNIVLADAAWTTSLDTLANGDGTRGSTVTGTKLAAMYTPAYRQTIQQFDFLVGTAATLGTVQGSIYTVSAGTPQTLLGTASEIFAAGSDIVSARAFKRFTMGQPITLEAGTTYAFVLEGTGLNANILSEIVTDAGAFSVGSSAWISGWVANAADIAFKVYGTGCDLRMRLTSTVTGAELLGFGVEYVEDAPLSLTGYSSFEDRIITAGEASSGTITLGACRYTVGAHQLQVLHKGHIFMAPDFTEITSNVVSFPAGFFITGDVVRFYVGFGLVDSTSQSLAKHSALNPIILGSAAQVNAGIATHSSAATAVAAATTGQKIVVLPGTYAGTISLTTRVLLEGSGYDCIFSGSWTIATGANMSTIRGVKFNATLTLNSSATFVRDCFVGPSGNVIDSGTANVLSLIQE